MLKQTKRTKASDAIKKEVPKYVRKWGNQFNRQFDDNTIEKIGDDMIAWFKSDPKNFWLKDFAIDQMIGVQRISEFAQKNEYFKWIYEMCQGIQESKVIRLGLNRKFNPALPVLILKNNHKWRDTFDVGLGLPEQYIESLKQEALRLMQSQL